MGLKKPNEIKQEFKSWALGFGLELTLCLMAQLTYPQSPESDFWNCVSVMWTVFGLTVFLKAASLVSWFAGGFSRQTNYRVLNILSLLPFAVYLVCIVRLHVKHCKYAEDTRKFTTYTHSMSNGTNSTDFRFFTIVCEESVLPVVSLAAVVAQVGVPMLFAFMVIKLSEPIWQIHLTRKCDRDQLQLNLLDFVDAANFITMPFAASSFVFFRHNPNWFLVVQILFVVAYLVAIAEIVIMSPTSKGWKIFKWLNSPRSSASISLWLNDLPFLVVRCYFTFVGLHVNMIFLAKNGLLIMHHLSVIYSGENENQVTLFLNQMVGLMPGADKVKAEGAAEMFENTHDTLEEQQKNFKRMEEDMAKRDLEIKLQKEELTNQKDMISSLRTIESVMNQEVKTPQELKKAFEFFDSDNSKKLGKKELTHLFSMLPKSKEIHPDIKSIVKERGGEHEEIEIHDFVKIFQEHASKSPVTSRATSEAGSSVEESGDDLEEGETTDGDEKKPLKR